MRKSYLRFEIFMKHIFYIVLFCCSLFDSYGQTVIFSNGGASYTNIDNTQPVFPVVDTYGSINISNCTSVRFSMDFSFSQTWPGNGNMESADECMGCSGLVQDALVTGCNTCWDFMHVELFLDGTSVFTELIGGAGETRQSGVIMWSGCTNGASNLTVQVTNMNWAADETNTFSNIIVECWDAHPTASYSPIPACEGQPLNLMGTIAVPADAISHVWSGSGGVIADPLALNTTVTGAFNGDTYTLTVTDVNSCTASSSVTVVLDPIEDADFILQDFCAPNSGAATITGTPGGTFTFNPPPGDGATINPTTGMISNATGGTTYSVQYTTPGTCFDVETNVVGAIAGPIGNLSGTAVLCPGECTTFSFSFSSGFEPYTIHLTVSPPGFPLPAIGGVSSTQVFNICYSGSGPFPTFDPGTFTFTIPTIYSGSGSLVLNDISDGSGCSGMASGSFNLTLTSGPTANNAGPLMACADMNGTATFDLTTLDNTINGGNGSLSVLWFEDAGGTIPIGNPSAYVSSGGTVYAKVTNGSCTSDEVAITIVVDAGNVPFIEMVCAESGTDFCTVCLTGNTIDLGFIFGDNNAYNVVVVDNSTLLQYTGTVSNNSGLTVPITSGTTFQLVDLQPLAGCPNIATYSDIVTINIVSAPDITPISIQPACQSIILPPITGTNLSGNGKYYTGPGGTGLAYDPGLTITTSQTLYIYDENGGCFDEEVVVITILPLVYFDQVPDLDGCGSVELPTITGIGVSSAAYYSSNPDGSGTIYYPGNSVNTSVTLYIYDPNADPDCLGNGVVFSVIIHELPPLPVITNIDCASGNSTGSFEVLSPLGTEYEYRIDNGTPQSSVLFTGIANGAHTITVINTITGCERSVSFSVNCNCPRPAVIILPAHEGFMCLNDTFLIEPIFYNNVTDLTIGHNGQGKFSIVGAAPLSIDYIPVEMDAGKTVVFTFTSNDPDGPGPCEPTVATFFLHVSHPIGVIQGPTSICSGSTVNLKATEGYQYSWSDNSSTSFEATYSNITSDSTFFVTLTDTLGCTNVLSHTVLVSSSSAGRDTSISFCNVLPVSVNLFDYLEPGYISGGIWKSGNDTILNPIDFLITGFPIGDTILNYIINDPSCGIDTAQLMVTIKAGNNAGRDANRQICEQNLDIWNLHTLLGIHDSGGLWSVSPSGTLDISNPNAVDLSTAIPGRYELSYIVSGNNCIPDTAIITLFIITKPNAGSDINASVCAGSQIDLFSLLSGVDMTGTFANINMYPGLSGSVWNTDGLPEGIYTFEYIVNGIFPCDNDQALISVEIKSALNAGADVEAEFCDTKTIDLFDFLDINADKGGRFYYQGVGYVDHIFATFNDRDEYEFRYEVGDNIVCPVVTSVLKLRKIKLSPFLGLGILDMCVGQCQDLFVGYDPSDIDEYTLSARVLSTNVELLRVQNAIDRVRDNDGFLIEICPDINWPVGAEVILTIESITMHNGFCTFDVNQPAIFKVLDLPVKSINTVLCSSETLSIGGQTFSVTNPSGEVIVSSGINNTCDTLVQVNLQFYPEAIGQFETSFCDASESIIIGNETFSFSRPEGTAVLPGAALNGCDSIVHVKIDYNKVVIAGTFTHTTCDENYEIVLGGQTFNFFNPTGQVLVSGIAAHGCDSLIHVNLNFEDFSFDYNIDYQCNDAPALLNISNATQAGAYTVILDGQIVNSNINVLPVSLQINSGTHSLQVVNSAGCTATENIVVNANDPIPDVLLTQEPLQDGTVQILVVSTQSSIYDLKWSPFGTLNCRDCTDPIANPDVTTTYTLTYLYGNDCQDARSITIERLVADVVIPNIFSPNNDGSNDNFLIFVPDKLSATIKNMSIYDRWGNLVYQVKDVQPNDPVIGWDGRLNGRIMNPGVYVYAVEVYFGALGQTKNYAGSVTLVR